MIDLSTQRYAVFALIAAALFGISAPLAKWLGASIEPVMLAALLYLGSGLSLLTLRGLRMSLGRTGGEAPLRRRDLPWLAGAVVTGGIAGPVLLMLGLRTTSGATASLLLAFEGGLTAVVAFVVFREQVDRRVWLALLLMVAASAALAYTSGGGFAVSVGVGYVLGACVCWALDNNLTRPISGADPTLIAMIKGLAAGAINLLLALQLNPTWPSPRSLAIAIALGALSYGISLVLFILALRHLGSARTAAHFGTAPFFGAAFAVFVMGESLTGGLIVAAALMALATWTVLRERHAHRHTHEPLEHEHYHEHDAHHQHPHVGTESSGAGHSHWHRHQPLTHSHAHLPDLHHRHGHD